MCFGYFVSRYYTAFEEIASQLPTLAVSTPDDRVGFGGVGAAQVGGVPFELLAQAESDVAEVIGFGKPAGVFEVGGGRLAGLTGADPFGVMAGRTRQRGGWPLEIGEGFFGQQDVA